MHNFFGHAHATMADCFWSGVYFHAEAERAVAACAGMAQAPDLVACRDPLTAHDLGEMPHGCRPVLYTELCRSETPADGEACVVYGQRAWLFLWFDHNQMAHGLITLATDAAGTEYARGCAKRRSLTP
jgi:hypothetical protein